MMLAALVATAVALAVLAGCEPQGTDGSSGNVANGRSAGEVSHTTDATDSVARGAVIKRTTPPPQKYDYYLYVPSSYAADPHETQTNRLLVVVHGLSRDAELQARLFAPLADSRGVAIVAPLFDEARFSGYQQLAAGGKTPVRADDALDMILADAKRTIGIDPGRFALFGYSAGGQFAHRYAMVHPERVDRLAVGAAGWYTFPDPSYDYPQGVATSPPSPPGSPSRPLDLAPFWRIPVLVAVGENDTSRGGTLEKSPSIDAQQGKTRLERGRAWEQAIERTAKAGGYSTSYQFLTLKRCGHDFAQCMTSGHMGESVIRFLFP
jgi:pimeloyl-ACP methyl ester carboxylesterase